MGGRWTRSRTPNGETMAAAVGELDCCVAEGERSAEQRAALLLARAICKRGGVSSNEAAQHFGKFSFILGQNKAIMVPN